MASQPDLHYAFSLQPEAAIRYFESLGYKITWDWRETAEAMRAQAFAVSNGATVNILGDIHDGLSAGLKEGLTERDFVKQLTPILQRKGWWGTQIAVDQQGGAQKIRLGSPARLKTIYRTNMQNAMMAGRWREFMANSSERPYFEYIAVMDSRTRPTHAALNGRVFRYDDPIWKTHWPPWAYNCRCRVRALSERALKRNGLKIESSDGKMRTIQQPWGTDKRTGEIISRPAKVLRITGPDGKPMDIGPSPGFGFNSGMGGGWDPIGNLPDLPPNAPLPRGAPGVIARMLPGQKTWRDYGRPDLRDVPADNRLPAPDMLRGQPNQDAALATLAGVLDVSPQAPVRFIETPIETVPINYRWLPHMVEKRDAARERYANFILPTLQRPFEAYLTQYDDGSWRRRYIGVFNARRQIMVVVRINSDGSLFWNFMQAKDSRMNRQRIGELVWAR
jgi:SPP1 gp7 family putative phage head morphogenesis protein